MRHAHRASNPSGPAPARPLPAVAVGNPSAVAARSRRRGWRQGSVSLGVALALHVALIVWIGRWPHAEEPPPPERLIHASLVTDRRVAAVVPEPPKRIPEVPDDLLEPPETLVGPPSESPRHGPTEGEALLGLGLGGGGAVGGWQGVDSPGRATDTGAGAARAEGFGDFIEDLRERGLDLVFVVDATGSMGPFLDRARETISQIISELAYVVPDLRLGLVAFRDLEDPWTTRHLPLTADRYGVENFVLDLGAGGGRRGGPDFEEALEEGLAVAIEGFAWRRNARQVLLLVGDAPYHEEDRSRCLELARRFARGTDAQVHTLYVGASQERRPTAQREQAREALRRIASAGTGLSFELAPEDASADRRLRQTVCDACFGSHWRAELSAFLAERPEDGRDRMVRKAVEQGETERLVRRLSEGSVRPSVVEGCVTLFDGGVARTCLALVMDEERPPKLRSAAWYVLKRGLRLAGVGLDLTRPLAEQEGTLLRVSDDVLVLPRPDWMRRGPPAPPRGR